MFTAPYTQPDILVFVPDDLNAKITAAVRERRVSKTLSVRRAAARSEGAISHSHWSNLENGYTNWTNATPVTVRGIERALEWKEGFLWNLIHGRNTSRITRNDGVFELSKADYVETVIVLISSEGNETEERTVTVRRENASGKLYGFTNPHNTVHSITVGQSVKVNSQKTFEIGDMVLVKASGQVMLAYARDEKASRVVTAQEIELKTTKVWGKVFERLENEGEFKQPKIN